MRKFRKWWRKHGAKVLLLTLILSIPIMLISHSVGQLILGVSTLLMLTVPCSIIKVNTNKPLWYLRQLFIFLLGINAIYQGII